MKNKQKNDKNSEQKTYKTVEEALNAKHDAARKFLAKVDIAKINALGQKG